jgi:hypothetical protein
MIESRPRLDLYTGWIPNSDFIPLRRHYLETSLVNAWTKLAEAALPSPQAPTATRRQRRQSSTYGRRQSSTYGRCHATSTLGPLRETFCADRWLRLRQDPAGRSPPHGSSICMYKNDVGVMCSRSSFFFLFRKLHEHILPRLPTSFSYIYDVL